MFSLQITVVTIQCFMMSLKALEIHQSVDVLIKNKGYHMSVEPTPSNADSIIQVLLATYPYIHVYVY